MGQQQERLPGQSEPLSVVVAVGENEFGSFLSAGYLTHQDSVLILGRRYLADGDKRAAWSVEELYERVLNADRGTIGMSQYQGGTWRIAPWRTLDLHSARARAGKGKRKRDESNETLLPLLKIPNKNGFVPKVEFDTRILQTQLQSNVVWIEQCHGCGKAVSDPVTACCLDLTEWTTREAITGNVGSAYYCGPACVLTKGVAKEWATASKLWALECSKRSGSHQYHWYLQSSDPDSPFWNALKSDDKTSKIIRDAGWDNTIDASKFILRADDCDGESD
jgi:hypothetical protein